MSGSTLVWLDGSMLKVFPLTSAAVVMGRSSEATVQLADPSVSRQHALLRAEPSGERVENLSQTNPAKVNRRRIEDPVTLSDGDVLRLGNVDVAFHKLASARRISGPVCSHCSRENPPDQSDCWFCGTSLVNARSAARSWTPVVFRVASRPPIPPSDVYPGEMVVFEPDGSIRIEHQGDPNGAASVTASERGPVIHRHSADTVIRVNGQELSGSLPLADGDTVQIAESVTVVLVNDLPT